MTRQEFETFALGVEKTYAQQLADENARHEQALKELKEQKQLLIAAAQKTLNETPTDKRRRGIAYRLQAAIKALVQEWGGKDVYDYASASCAFEVADGLSFPAMQFTVVLPFKEPAEPAE